MKKLLYISLITMSIRCEKQRGREIINNKNIENVILLNKRKNPNEDQIKQDLNNIFFRYQYTLKSFYKDSDIIVYSIKLYENIPIPNNIKRDYIAIDIIERGIQYLIPIEINQIFKIDNQMMLGGFYNIREYDYYHIYKLENESIDMVLNTYNISDNSIAVGYYKDDECQEYIPNRLNFHYNNHYRIIYFEGKILDYCEDGVDRNDNDNIRNIKNTHLSFIYKNRQWVYEKNGNISNPIKDKTKNPDKTHP